MVKLLEPSADRLIRAVPPDRAPDFKDAGPQLWVIKKVETEIYTESNAGWDLYARCRMGNIAVSDARELVADKFGRRGYSWADVMQWFRKHGGRHTDKYLRVD